MENKTNKKFIINIVAFVIVLAIAATAFSVGFTQLTKQDEGIALIEEYPDSDAGLYAQDFELYYNLYGKQSDIKAVKKALSELFSTRLLYIYKLTDPENEYENMNNLATINHNPGQAVKIDETLYNMLKRAYGLSSDGYSLFAGGFYKTFNALIYAGDAQEQDPIINPENREMIASLLASALDPANNLAFNDDTLEVTLTVSDSLKNNSYAESMPVVDLNYLRNAFLANEIAAYLSDKGYKEGYILTKDGLTVMLRSFAGGSYILNRKDGTSERVPITTGSCSSSINNFFTGILDAGEYSLTGKGGEDIIRTPFIILTETGLNDAIESVMSISESGDAVSAKYSAMMLLTKVGDNNEELKEALESETDTKIYFNVN